MTRPARPARPGPAVFYPYCTPSVEVTVNAGSPMRPPRRHRTPWPLLPVTLSWVFYLPDPTRRRPGWAGGRASPPRAPHLEAHLPGPTLCSHFLSMGTISAIILLHGPGRARSPIWALRPPNPAGLGFVGDQASWLFMKTTQPRLGASSTLPGLHPQPSAHRAQGPQWLDQPRTRAPGPLPVPVAGEGRWGFPLTTPVAVPTSP